MEVRTLCQLLDAGLELTYYCYCNLTTLRTTELPRDEAGWLTFTIGSS